MIHPRFAVMLVLGVLLAGRSALAEDELPPPKPAHLPDLDMDVHHVVPDAGPLVDAGPLLLADGGLAPVPPPDQAAILKAVGAVQGAIGVCVEDEQRHHPGWLATKVSAGFTITPKGTITAAKLGDPKINKSKLGTCLRAALGTIVLPAFDGEALQVEVPLVLRNRGSGEPSSHSSASH